MEISHVFHLNIRRFALHFKGDVRIGTNETIVKLSGAVK